MKQLKESFYNYKISFEEMENKMQLLKQELINFISEIYSVSIEKFHNGFYFHLNGLFYAVVIDKGELILYIEKKEIKLDSKEMLEENLKKYIEDKTMISNSNI